MLAIINPVHAGVRQSHRRPILDSYDSAQECSFYHWIEVCKLVDDAEIPSPEEELEYSLEIEEALEDTLSEMESATAYQHFAGNVV